MIVLAGNRDLTGDEHSAEHERHGSFATGQEETDEDAEDAED